MSIDSIISTINKLVSRIEENTGISSVPESKSISHVEQPATNELPAIVEAFSKCDIRVTEIVECQRVDFSDKLLLCKLRTSATGTRTFAAGIGPWYSPDELIGKKIITILNLKPRPMAEGRIVSEAMLFAGSYDDHKTVELCCPSQDVEVGTRVLPEGFELLPVADGQPKKNFDRVLEALHSQHHAMYLGDIRLLAGGVPIIVNCPDGSSLG